MCDKQLGLHSSVVTVGIIEVDCEKVKKHFG